MKMQPIIKAIGEAHQYAAALEIIAPISVTPGEVADIATIAQAAQRLADQLGAIQRQIRREVSAMKATNTRTMGQQDEDVVNMLIRSQDAAQEA